jgi:hypothetical protein
VKGIDTFSPVESWGPRTIGGSRLLVAALVLLHGEQRIKGGCTRFSFVGLVVTDAVVTKVVSAGGVVNAMVGSRKFMKFDIGLVLGDAAWD